MTVVPFPPQISFLRRRRGFAGAASLALTMAASSVLIYSSAHGALPATDNAGNYNGDGQPNYQNGANAGTGFQPFIFFANGSAGNFLANSYPATQSAINTNGKVFDTYAQFSGIAGATRSFTSNDGTGIGTLDVGQTVAFRLDLANTVMGSDSANVGFTIESNNSQSINFAVSGGNASNTFSGGYGALTGIRLDTLEGGVAFNLTVDSARQFTVTAQGITDLSVMGSFTYTTTNDLNLTGLTIYDYNSGPNNDLLFNDLEVSAVPEPATYLAGFGGVAVVLVQLRRRRCRPARPVDA